MAPNPDGHRPVPKEALGWRIYAIAASAAMASAMFGYDSAFIGGTLALPSFQRSFGLNKGTATALKANINLGRKINLIVAGLIFSVGAIVQTVSFGNLAMMYTGRAFTGLGVGASAMIVPIYISESAPPVIRGRLIGVSEVTLQVASVCGFWVNYGVDQNMESNVRRWQVPFAIQLVPAGLLVLSMLWAPEARRWLVKKGKNAQALKTLAWIRNLPESHEYVQTELAEMQAQVERESEFTEGGGFIKAAWKECSVKGMRNRIILAVAMKWMQNFAGVNALNYYSPSIFRSIGFTGTSTGLLATGVYGLVKAATTLVFVTWFVDTWGRRPALFTGGMISTFAMFFLGTYSAISRSFEGNAPKDAGAYFAIIMIYVYAAAYSFSWNAMPWMFAAEIFPTKIRGFAMLLTVLNQWLSQFVIIYSTPYMIEDISFGVFFFSGACILASSIIVFCFIPETKQFPLEKMHLIFEGSLWARKARKDAEVQLAREREEEREQDTTYEEVSMDKPSARIETA